MHNCDRGFTLIELLVTLALGLLVLTLALSAVIANREVMGRDTIRTRLNQNIRGALDITGFDVRVAGENLSTAFPAVELINGTAGAPDQLIIRRNLLDEVLPVCAQVTPTSGTLVYFAVPGTLPAGCSYAGQTASFNSWSAFRASNGPTLEAYIYNSGTKVGEFFDYIAETNHGATASRYSLTRAPGSFSTTYPAGTSAVYLMEEWKYQLNGDMLQVVQNRDNANPLTVAFGITDFQASIIMQDGTTRTSFTTTDPWSQIRQISITVSGRDQFRGEPITRTMSARFFPRNVLSL